MDIQPEATASERTFSSWDSLLIFAPCAALAELLLGRNFWAGRFSSEDLPLGWFFIVLISLCVIHSFIRKSFRHYRPSRRNLIFAGLTLAASILIVKAGLIVAQSLAAYSRTPAHMAEIAPASFVFAIPFAAGGLLLQTILGWHYSLLFALSASVITGCYLGDPQIIVPYTLVTTLMGALRISSLRSRTTYTKAGFAIALSGLAITLSSLLLDHSFSTTEIVVRLLAPFICGALSAFIAAGVTPVMEYLGGFVTDLRLLELATLDHPLLKELSYSCPGTWNHSMVMGMIAESAADAIGANPVIARVGAYFHDVGKIRKPLYFIENQSPHENRHDKLSTSMSALIIRSHVKDGMELAQKHRLPVIIQDLIPQHHGTSVIEFFYNKACKEAEEAGLSPSDVDISLYSYPGPRPQTREAGIIMLADGMEAAVRTVEELTHDRIQGLVQKRINKIFASGQLDECELTLKDLHVIAKCFTRVLSGIYHQRIAYAEPAEKISEKGAFKAQNGHNSKTGEPHAAPLPMADSGQPQLAETENTDESTDSDGKEDLKRLGI